MKIEKKKRLNIGKAHALFIKYYNFFFAVNKDGMDITTTKKHM